MEVMRQQKRLASTTNAELDYLHDGLGAFVIDSMHGRQTNLLYYWARMLINEGAAKDTMTDPGFSSEVLKTAFNAAWSFMQECSTFSPPETLADLPLFYFYVRHILQG
jgi:hypothetical protein